MNPIIIAEQPSKSLSKALSSLSFSSLFILTDENTQEYCFPLVKNALPESYFHFTFPAGEKHKNLETCAEIWTEMTEAGLDRKALVLNLGGGVLGDMGGFCASIYKRGIRFINLPTTLLSQVDASVGGKLGVDFEGLKNHLGVFNEPELVLICPHFLKTLPSNELRSGFAEIIKHGLIRDKEYFENLDFKNWKENDWKSLISHSVEIKKSVVQEDPKEAGLRKILNFGHTIGHALETHFLDSPYHLLHGEAIAAGMICEAWLSVEKCQMSSADLEQITQSLLEVYGKIKLNKSDFEPVLNLCLQDKKNEGKEILFSLLEKIGSCTFNVPVNKSEIAAALTYYQNL
ncbi:3-dehydroquinate synthase [Algoriphagus sp. NBT04N3]|uniref:3-dehydroquinate synthase n=1 Tax=Algoriphagus sp. NBT04N3 TaxID=2705473 RepID=UPI001C62D2DA|nr:3-dehydroquinate synthase [Algoriphagus sp. NBT04N3]QYH38824.1 3-dehydroquinate synthase [Algoriphagus sp. NBT04N3]